jgi:serine/threonine-protein kinase
MNGEKPTISIGGFEIYQSLGEGGMGAVYRARNLETDQIVALKVLYPLLAGNTTYIERFKAEAENALQLDHQNLVKVFSWGCRGLNYFIEMEYVEGKNLGTLLKEGGALPEVEVAVMGMCVASALHYAWEKSRLIHRDVKPGNLIIGDKGSLKLCDLGIAKCIVEGRKSLTRAGTSLGSPHYIAPEQARGEKDINYRADIYALGATLYHAVTGVTVHDADSEFSLMVKHATVPVRNLREIKPELNDLFVALLMRMLELDQNKRAQDWYTLYGELETILKKIAPDRLSRIF